MKTYRINEVFYSLQGEGVRAGTANYFVRFAGCNLQCDVEPGPLSPGGFACDTEFTASRQMTLSEIFGLMKDLTGGEYGAKAVILTGGEPLLQVDDELLRGFKEEGFYIAVETNGTRPVPFGIDWVTLSPKVAEHALKQTVADEVKYVRGLGQACPKTSVQATYNLISPAFDGSSLDAKTLAWCISLVKENPVWRLSVQQHKGWVIR